MTLYITLNVEITSLIKIASNVKIILLMKQIKSLCGKVYEFCRGCVKILNVRF